MWIRGRGVMLTQRLRFISLYCAVNSHRNCSLPPTETIQKSEGSLGIPSTKAKHNIKAPDDWVSPASTWPHALALQAVAYSYCSSSWLLLFGNLRPVRCARSTSPYAPPPRPPVWVSNFKVRTSNAEDPNRGPAMVKQLASYGREGSQAERKRVAISRPRGWLHAAAELRTLRQREHPPSTSSASSNFQQLASVSTHKSSNLLQ